MALLSSYNKSNNQKLYFSKEELTKILGVYSQYVAKGEWKDYAMDFDNKNAFFYTYKNTNTKPDCIFTKYKENNKKKIFYKLVFKNKSKNYNNLENLIKYLKRKQFKIIN